MSSETIGVKIEGVDYDPPFDEKEVLDPPFEADQREEPVFLDDPTRTYDQGFIEGGKGAGPKTIVIRDGRTMHEQRSSTAVRVIYINGAVNEESMQRITHGTATAESPRRFVLIRRRTPTPEQKLHSLQGTPIPRPRVAKLSVPEANARKLALTHKGQQIPVYTL